MATLLTPHPYLLTLTPQFRPAQFLRNHTFRIRRSLFIFSAASQRCSCSDNLKVPWNAKSEKQSERNNSQHTSEAELGCNFQKDTAGNGRACFKFYISDYNNNPTNNSFNTPYVTEVYSCMQNGVQVDIVKSDRVAVSVHERFFNGKLLTGTWISCS